MRRCSVRDGVVGFYSSRLEVISLTGSALTDRASSTVTLLHEALHRDLAEKTFGGFLERLLVGLGGVVITRSAADQNDIEGAVDHIARTSWIVQEGTAVYTSMCGLGPDAREVEASRLPVAYRDAAEVLCRAIAPLAELDDVASLIEGRIAATVAKGVLNESYRSVVERSAPTSVEELRELVEAVDSDSIFVETLQRLSETGALALLREEAPEYFGVHRRTEVLDRFVQELVEPALVPNAGSNGDTEAWSTPFEDAVYRATVGHDPPRSSELGQALRAMTDRWSASVADRTGVRPLADVVFGDVPDNLPTWVTVDADGSVDQFWDWTEPHGQTFDDGVGYLSSAFANVDVTVHMPVLHVALVTDVVTGVVLRLDPYTVPIGEPEVGPTSVFDCRPIGHALADPLVVRLDDVRQIGGLVSGATGLGVQVLWYASEQRHPALLDLFRRGRRLPGLTFVSAETGSSEALTGEIVWRAARETTTVRPVLAFNGALCPIFVDSGPLQPWLGFRWTCALPLVAAIETVRKLQTHLGTDRLSLTAAHDPWDLLASHHLHGCGRAR